MGERIEDLQKLDDSEQSDVSIGDHSGLHERSACTRDG